MKYFYTAMLLTIAVGILTSLPSHAQNVVLCEKLYPPNRGLVQQFVDYCPRGWVQID